MENPVLTVTRRLGTTVSDAGIGLAQSWWWLMEFAQPRLQRPPRDPDSLFSLSS